MRQTTRDPITGHDVADRSSAPFVIEGQGSSALKIYFQSEQSKAAYLEIPTRYPEACNINFYIPFKNNEDILWD